MLLCPVCIFRPLVSPPLQIFTNLINPLLYLHFLLLPCSLKSCKPLFVSIFNPLSTVLFILQARTWLIPQAKCPTIGRRKIKISHFEVATNVLSLISNGPSLVSSILEKYFLTLAPFLHSPRSFFKHSPCYPNLSNPSSIISADNQAYYSK